MSKWDPIDTLTWIQTDPGEWETEWVLLGWECNGKQFGDVRYGRGVAWTDRGKHVTKWETAPKNCPEYTDPPTHCRTLPSPPMSEELLENFHDIRIGETPIGEYDGVTE